MIRKSDEATKKSRFADEIGESYGEKMDRVAIFAAQIGAAYM